MYSKEIPPRTVLVTGAAQGIGKAIAFAFVRKGYYAVLADKETKKLKHTVKELRQFNPHVIGVRTNVFQEKDVARTVKMGLEKFGKIDFLVNNAGVALSKPLTETSGKEWEKVLDTNLKGSFLFCKHAVPAMEKEKFGVVVNIASGLGKHGMQSLSAYSASKFGLIGLTESLADEVKDKGIKVFAICPGGVNTDMYKNLFTNYNPANLYKPETIAEQVFKVCTESYLFKNGQSIELY